MTELCLSLVIIPKIKKKEHYKNTNIFGTVDEGCCVKLSRVTYFRQSSCTHMYYRPPTHCILQKPVGEIDQRRLQLINAEGRLGQSYFFKKPFCQLINVNACNAG